MSKLPGAFNANEVDDMDTFEPIPAAEYDFEIVKAPDKKRNSKDIGFVYPLHFKVINDTKFNGRLVFVSLNLEHDDDDTELRARKELGAICRAAGRPNIEGHDELVGAQLRGKVVVKEKTQKWPAGNTLKKYMPLEGVSTATKPSAGAKRPSNPGASASKPTGKPPVKKKTPNVGFK